MPIDKKKSLKGKSASASGRGLKQTASVYSKKAALLEDAITQMNAGKYGRSSSALKELLAMDPHNMEARRLFATLHLRLGSLIPARQAFDSLIDEAFARQDYWLAESLLREYLAAGPRCVPYLEKLGSIHQDKGEVDEAVEQFGKAVDILVEDPDSDNPNHASQLYEKIKSLAPGSFVETRVAGYFDVRTGALIARPSDDAGIDSSVSDEVSGSTTDSEPMAEIGPWGTTGEPLPVEEAGASVDNPEMPPDDSGLVQLEEVPEAVGNMSVSDQPMAASEAGLVEAEPASTLLDNPTDFVLQQAEVLDDVPQNIPQEQEIAEQVVPDLMPGADFQETMPEMPRQAPMDSADALSFTVEPDQTSSSPSLDPMPWGEGQQTTPEESSQAPLDSAKDVSFASEPDQILPSPPPDSPKGGAFSWDSVFKNVWNKNGGSGSTASAPTMGVPHKGMSSLSEPDTAEAPSAGAPMPWDQVQDSTIRISPGQTDEGSAESPIDQARLSGSALETKPWVDQERVTEQDQPLSLVQSGEETRESQDVPINPSVTDQALGETEPSVDAVPPVYVPGESSVEQQEPESQPFSFSFSSEEPTATEEAASDSGWNPTGQSVTEEERVSTPAQYESPSFSLEGESIETPSESDANELGQVSIPDQLPPSGHARDASPHIDRHIGNEDKRPLQTQSQVQPEEPRKPAFVEAKAPLLDPSPQSEDEWSKPEESIRFVGNQPAAFSAGKDQAPSLWRSPIGSGVEAAAASAGSVPIESPSDRAIQAESREQVTRPRPRRKGPSLLSRIGAAISGFIGSCFSTTRAIVMSLVALAVLACVAAALAVGAVGMTWMIMEEAPSPAYQAFTVGPQQTISDSNKNGYVLLMGFDAPAGQSPSQVGDERRTDGADKEHVQACLGSPGVGGNAANGTVPEKILSGWFRGSDPVGQFTANQGAIGRWVNQGERMLGRYRQWQKLPFEDWGYGRAVAPPCAAVNFAHRLYVAEGFAQQTDIGIDRLEADMEAWRIVMAQARTLPIKVLAIQAVRDDAAVASGLLARPDVDGKHIGRLSHMLRPLNQEELSVRWPLQSELVWAAKTFDTQVKAAKQDRQPLHAAIASALPLPSQRRLNSYAAYYEAANQAAEEGRHGALPKLAGFIKAPASTVADYFVNPIETVIGLDPLPAWDVYNGLAVDADAHLRLASLQAWIRRGWQDTELLSRIAKAGQTFYDPYTGLPMLVNLKKRLLYSVGHDLKDQDGDPQDDVVVAIPGNPAFK